ncbi:MAG: hypothetical protein R3E01_25675 [Pirellulaceae bacterium]|nr:hypothetical protein [Planctomycetales bacterium]
MTSPQDSGANMAAGDQHCSDNVGIGDELMESPPASAPVRRWISVAVVLFLLSQITIPATYYLRGEPTSERFAWRMFSSVHMTNWRCRVIETSLVNGNLIERELALDNIVQESTVRCLHTGQLDVVEPFLLKRLAREGVQRIEYVAEGTTPSGQPTAPIRLVADATTREVRRIDLPEVNVPSN